jgi:hypothetical protein
LGFIGIADVQTLGAEGVNIPPIAPQAIPRWEKLSGRWQFERNNMIDHIILTVSNVEHSLAF